LEVQLDQHLVAPQDWPPPFRASLVRLRLPPVPDPHRLLRRLERPALSESVER
jgi:hypothetical protein